MNILQIALSQYGTKEIAGKNNDQTIVNYAKESGFYWVNDDETPWCSIFMNWVTMKAGLERTHKANARSWLKIGEDVIVPETGDIVIFKRGNSTWQGHVAIFLNIEGLYINVLGGNQHDSVSVAKYRITDVLGYRRLKLL